MATQRKYIREVPEQSEHQDDLIRINTRTENSRFIKRVIWLLQGSKNSQQEAKIEDQIKTMDTTTLTALDNAIPKALIIAEVVRRRVPDLYQISTISNIKIPEVYSPTEEGLLTVKITREFASLTIKLTKVPSEEDKKAPGFHEPPPADQLDMRDNEGKNNMNNRRGDGRTQSQGRDRPDNGNRNNRDGDNRDQRNRN